VRKTADDDCKLQAHLSIIQFEIANYQLSIVNFPQKHPLDRQPCLSLAMRGCPR
jgi:hypothetical protein